MVSPNAIVLIVGISILILSFVWVQARHGHYEKHKRIPGSIADLTPEELEALIRRVVREELNREQVSGTQLDTAMDSDNEEISPPPKTVSHDSITG